MLAADGGPNAMFFTCLFSDKPMDVGLLRSKELCNTCGGDITHNTHHL